jgi:hypothetical protein
MKIVQMMESSATGTLSMVCLIANRFAREGHEVHVVYSIRDETPVDIHAMFDRNVALRHVQMKGVPLLPALARLTSVLREIQPDVIHLHRRLPGFSGDSRHCSRRDVQPCCTARIASHSCAGIFHRLRDLHSSRWNGWRRCASACTSRALKAKAGRYVHTFGSRSLWWKTRWATCVRAQASWRSEVSRP